MAKGSPKKLTITAFKDPKFKKKIGSISLQMNPEEYTWVHSAQGDRQFGTKKELNKKRSRPFGQLNPQTMSFNFWLDATGATGNIVNITVVIKEFRKLTCEYNGETHGINYLILVWGKFSFKCQLTELSVSYKLFNSKGIPLRANCSVSFVEFIDNATLNAKRNKSSPDLTHVYTVKVGDTLPNISFNTYGSTKYYLQLAKENGLTNFRQLKAGQKITLPPLDKS